MRDMLSLEDFSDQFHIQYPEYINFNRDPKSNRIPNPINTSVDPFDTGYIISRFSVTYLN